MTTATAIQEPIDLAPHVPSAMKDEAKQLLRLYWILDLWMADVESIEWQKIHTQSLRVQLNRLVHYYFEKGQRNKAKLAVMLSGAALNSEECSLTYTQINVIQTVLIYFQRANLTLDDLKQCHRTLLDHNIFTLPTMPNWQVAILDH